MTPVQIAAEYLDRTPVATPAPVAPILSPLDLRLAVSIIGAFPVLLAVAMLAIN